jgi:hypothetical protein
MRSSCPALVEGRLCRYGVKRRLALSYSFSAYGCLLIGLVI